MLCFSLFKLPNSTKSLLVHHSTEEVYSNKYWSGLSQSWIDNTFMTNRNIIKWVCLTFHAESLDDALNIYKLLEE